MMRTLLATTALVLSITGAAACSCMRPGPDAPKPEIIVEGRVMGVKQLGTGIVARMKVTRVVKGRTGPLINIHTAGSSAACGVDFQRGQSGPFALSRHDGKYTANSCMQFLLNAGRIPRQ